jgi:branched-chain amino acid transport system substrate-binding protein
MPYSGPASTYGVNGRTEVAYCKMTNEMGGVNGRKLNLISLDDGLSPPKTAEQIRRLIELEQVAFIFGTLGTASNAAIGSAIGMWKNWPMQHNCPVCSTDGNPHQRVDCS